MCLYDWRMMIHGSGLMSKKGICSMLRVIYSNIIEREWLAPLHQDEYYSSALFNILSYFWFNKSSFQQFPSLYIAPRDHHNSIPKDTQWSLIISIYWMCRFCDKFLVLTIMHKMCQLFILVVSHHQQQQHLDNSLDSSRNINLQIRKTMDNLIV